MPAYLSTAAVSGRLKASFAQLYKLPTDQTDLDTDMAVAESQVHAYIGKRYVVPVTAEEALVLVKGWALDLFEEIAWRRGAGSELPKKVAGAADVARRQLADLAKGALSLAGAVVAENPDAGAGAQIVEGNTPQFKRDDLAGF